MFAGRGLKSKQGSALTTVIVLSGMVGLFGLAVMQTARDQSDAQRNVRVRDSADKVTESIRSILQHQATCKINFEHTPNPNFTKDTDGPTGDFSEILNENKDVLFKEGNTEPYYSYGYLKKMSYEFDSGKDMALIELVFKKYKSTTNFASKRTIIRRIPVKMNFCRPEDISSVPMPMSNEDCKTKSVGDLKNCFALFGNPESITSITSADNPLKDACTNLGGYFDTTTGLCNMVEYQAALVKEGFTVGSDKVKSLCEQMDGKWDNTSKECTPILADEKCAPGELLTGWETDGTLICKVPPAGPSTGRADWSHYYLPTGADAWTASRLWMYYQYAAD